MSERSLNAVYTLPTMRRRYEVWFLKLMLADGSGAWWFRYLLLNLGRGGCGADGHSRPVQVWATWFPRDDTPRHFFEGFSKDGLSISSHGSEALEFGIGGCRITDNSCAGQIDSSGHRLSWELTYGSTFGDSITDLGWIGFSRTPHSDAIFSGRIKLDGRVFTGNPLGYGLQGHNCGYRHRKQWTWTHSVALDASGGMTTFEALEYEIGFGFRFRKAVLWHQGKKFVFKKLSESERDRAAMRWVFKCVGPGDTELLAEIDGSGPSVIRLPYTKTDCSGSFDVSNNSLARAALRFSNEGWTEQIDCDGGAVLEMVGD
ncbi:MAG TPA: hypothetical protein VFV34_15110 [Blastocatellia bacterium]|nr:hypothetical protein [Blastocatellia bacterium]